MGFPVAKLGGFSAFMEVKLGGFGLELPDCAKDIL